MEQFIKKIYSGFFLIFFDVMLFMILNLIIISPAMAESGFENVSMKKFISPKYNEKTEKLEYILTGTNAQTVGAFIKITDVRIDMVGPDGKSINNVITTPEAFFNRATEIVRSDKPIKYQSLPAIIDGVGFDCNMKTQLFHIRKNVKMLITSKKTIQGQTNKSQSQTNKPTKQKKKKIVTKITCLRVHSMAEL